MRLSRAGNHLAASHLLRSAVRVDPSSLVAHRRLAAALANAGDPDAAAEEYSRFIEVCLSRNDVSRAVLELGYGQTVLGDPPQLRRAAASVARLSDLARVSGSRALETEAIPDVKPAESASRLHRRSRTRKASSAAMSFFVLMFAALVGVIFTFATLGITEVR